MPEKITDKENGYNRAFRYYVESAKFHSFLSEHLAEKNTKTNLLKAFECSYFQVHECAYGIEKLREELLKASEKALEFHLYLDSKLKEKNIQGYVNEGGVYAETHNPYLSIRTSITNQLKLFYYLLSSHLDLMALICLFSKGVWEITNNNANSIIKLPRMPPMKYVITKAEELDQHIQGNFFKNVKKQLTWFITPQNTVRVDEEITEEKLIYPLNVRHSFIHKALDIHTAYIKGMTTNEHCIFFFFTPFSSLGRYDLYRYDRELSQTLVPPGVDFKKFLFEFYESRGFKPHSFDEIHVLLEKLTNFYSFFINELENQELK